MAKYNPQITGKYIKSCVTQPNEILMLTLLLLGTTKVDVVARVSTHDMVPKKWDVGRFLLSLQVSSDLRRPACFFGPDLRDYVIVRSDSDMQTKTQCNEYIYI